MKSRAHPTYKTQYHVQNWAAYGRALVCRGDITIWLSPAAIASWDPDGAGTRGAQRKYSDLAIESAWTLRLLFHLLGEIRYVSEVTLYVWKKKSGAGTSSGGSIRRI